MDPAKGALDSPVDLAGAPPTEELNAKDTREMYQRHVSSSEEEENEDEEIDDQGGEAKERTIDDELFKYYGYSWPEVVGLKAHKAKRIIGKGKPDIHFQVVSQNQLLTMCYCSRRVRLIVDGSNCVVRTPRVG
uniref:Uncharacterized protein n=1 Tax=Avena sativa TaxID=4498 RepID=A0ACD5T6U1_AVESA